MSLSGCLSPAQPKACRKEQMSSCCLEQPHVVWGCFPGKKRGEESRVGGERVRRHKQELR